MLKNRHSIRREIHKTGRLTVKGKNGKIRTVSINEAIQEKLKKMLAQTSRGQKLFVPEGEKTDNVKGQVENFIYYHRDKVQCEKCDRPITFHGLRHTFACELYRKYRTDGRNHDTACKLVSSILGHERGDVTMIYLASIKERNKD